MIKSRYGRRAGCSRAQNKGVKDGNFRGNIATATQAPRFPLEAMNGLREGTVEKMITGGGYALLSCHRKQSVALDVKLSEDVQVS